MSNEPDKIIYSMIRVSKRHGQREVLKDISLSYFYGAKIGVLGLNGSGKSSLLKILAGVDQSFEGKTVLAPGYTIGYLEQEPLVNEMRTVREVVEEGAQELVNLVKEFEEINAKFAEPMEPEEMDKLIERQGQVQELMDAKGAWDLDSKLEMAMDALRCPPGDTPVSVISGGEKRRVALCRLLQKKKSYYYKTNHFVSISSMVYRMKRNGAGLASICILCTMVLVMVSSTVCLYIGAEDSLRTRYPRNINLNATVSSLEMLNSDYKEQVKALAEEVSREHGAAPENTLDYRYADFGGYLQGNTLMLELPDSVNQLSEVTNMWQVFVVPLEDYNRLMGTEEALAPGEAMVFTTKEQQYTQPTIAFGDGAPLTVKKQVESFVDNGVDAMQIIPTMYLFVPNFDEIVRPLMETENETGNVVNLRWIYGFDLPCDDDTQIQIHEQLSSSLSQMEEGIGEGKFFHVLLEGVAKERAGFYGLYGGLFFLGILLGIVFIFAAVLIIYYKQVSEGYEDQARFAIMQKVGMTKKEIRRSINSQILTVFFLPLITAGIHVAAAFPAVSRMLALFNLTNTWLFFWCTAICFVIFAVFYAIVYLLTARTYYRLVR